MFFKQWVFKVVRSEFQTTRTLNYWIVWSVNMNNTICKFSASKLRAAHSNFTKLAIAHEYGCFDGANIEFGVFTSIHLDLCSMVQKKNLAIFKVFYHEIYSIYVAWVLD